MIDPYLRRYSSTIPFSSYNKKNNNNEVFARQILNCADCGNYHCQHRSNIRKSCGLVFVAYADFRRITILPARSKVTVASGSSRYCSLATAFDSVSCDICSVSNFGCFGRFHSSGVERIYFLCRHSLFVRLAFNGPIVDSFHVHRWW